MPVRNIALALDQVHCRAICNEIGERLRYVLSQDPSPIPPRLNELIDKLMEMEQAPSIVPSIDEMSSLGKLAASASRTR
jgi:hypothetical protein